MHIVFPCRYLKKKHPVLPDTPPKEGELRTTSPLEGCLKGGVDSKDK